MKTKMLRIGIVGLLFAGVSLFGGCGRDDDQAKWVETAYVVQRTDGSKRHIEFTLGADHNVKWRYGKPAD